MIPKELFRKIRKIEISTSRLVTDVFAGQYHSVFKGQGIEFDEVREYLPGDDVRTIDWNVTARTGKPHIKKFIEERELTVMIMVDISASCQFASVNMLKSQLAAEISAVLALAAIRNNDKVGLIMFSDKIEKFIAPRKGSKHVLRIIREVLYDKPQGHDTNIVQALEYLTKIAKRKSIVFLISDFLTDHQGKAPEVMDSWLKKILTITNKRHDLIAVTLNDPREKEWPDCGLITVRDAETHQTACIDTSDAFLRQQYYQNNKTRIDTREKLFRSVGMDFMNVSTDQPYMDEIVKFFLKRKKKVIALS